jgi:microcystin-dependent protein
MAWKFFTSSGVEKVEDQPETPAGLITSFAGASAPTGWLLCQGQELSRTTYAKLDAALGQVYGVYTNGSGAAGNTHFKVPDLTGRVVAGIYAGAGDSSSDVGAPSGTSIPDSMLGTTAGASTVTLSAAQSGVASHTHAPTAGSHTHLVIHQSGHNHTFGHNTASYETSTGSTITNVFLDAITAQDKFTNTATTGVTFASATSGITLAAKTAAAAASSHDNKQPNLQMHFMIYTGL